MGFVDSKKNVEYHQSELLKMDIGLCDYVGMKMSITSAQEFKNVYFCIEKGQFG